MRCNLPLHLLSVLVLTVLLFVCTSGLHISFDGESLTNGFDGEILIRTKREIENFDTAPDGLQTSTAFEEQQEESSFWDRVVKVALKLFSRFIEWLNN